MGLIIKHIKIIETVKESSSDLLSILDLLIMKSCNRNIRRKVATLCKGGNDIYIYIYIL